jgi:hypothetical protein
MYNEDQYPDLPYGEGGWRLDPSYEADRLSTDFGMVSDPVETATYIDRIAQRSSGWFRSF